MKIKKTVLVTGASGTVGFEVVKQLERKLDQFQVTVLDVSNLKSRKRLGQLSSEINIVYGDIGNDAVLQSICTAKDYVIHLAAIIPPLADEEPDLAHKVNTVGTENLIRKLEQYSPHAFFIYSSSISVYGDRLATPLIKVSDPLIPSARDAYAETKIEAEKILQESNLNWTIFRLTAIMGGHKMSKLMFHQPLNTSFEIATPEDTARAFVNSLEHKEKLNKQIFNLGGGEACRTVYDVFLAQSFKMFGLGNLNFPDKVFAEKNFHCGFYVDGDDLNHIIQFREDTLESYFEKERAKSNCFSRFLLSVFQKPIKKYLQKQSEPYQAYLKKDKVEMNHYFGEA